MFRNCNRIKLIVFVLLTVGCAAAIFLFSAQERTVSSSNSLKTLTIIAEFIGRIFRVQVGVEQIAGLHNFFRKTAHFSIYMLLAVFSYNAFRLIFRDKRQAVVIAIGFCVLMAISDEIHQMFVPGRSGEVRDVLIDALGACAGIGLVGLIDAAAKTVRRRKERKFINS